MILIDDRQGAVTAEDSLVTTINEVVEYALKEEKLIHDYEVSVVFVNNEEIKEINKEFRQIDRVTDVLSFPMLDYPKGKVFKDVYEDNKFKIEDLDDGKLVLGDIVLSLEKAKEQSEEFGHSFLRECAYLTVHSVLHLLGYDHMEEDDKIKMRKREEEILNTFNITRQ